MARGKDKDDTAYCPVGKFFLELERVSGKKSKFFDHLDRSRVEFLKAIRSLVDEKIVDIEKKGAAKGGRKVKKIKVE